MIRFNLFGTTVSVSYLFIFTLSILILFDRTGMVAVSLLAVMVHETGHFFAIKMLKINCISLDFCLSTVGVTTGGILNFKNTAIISLCGPLVNMLFSCCIILQNNLLRYFGAANVIMFIFNMLPIKGLDGGDILHCILICTKLKSPTKIFSVISIFFTGIIIILGGVLFIATKQNPTLFFVGIYLLILSFRKI